MTKAGAIPAFTFGERATNSPDDFVGGLHNYSCRFITIQEKRHGTEKPPRPAPRADAAKTGLSISSIARLEKAGDFPQHFLLTPRCAAWFEDEIDAWLEDRRAKAIAAASWPNVLLRKRNPVRQVAA